MRVLPVVSCLLISTNVMAAEEKAPDASTWKGDVELGLVIATGNTETKTANGKVDVENDRIDWRHNVIFEVLFSEESEERTAEKYTLTGKTDYKLPEDSFLFAIGTYENDQFSGYDYQLSVALGYGKRLIKQEGLFLDAEIGPGYRYSELADGGNESEGILRLGAELGWEISENATFNQKLSTEIGEESTITKSTTSLTTKINSSLSFKSALDIKHDSGAPEGSKETDTKTSISLVYGF